MLSRVVDFRNHAIDVVKLKVQFIRDSRHRMAAIAQSNLLVTEIVAVDVTADANYNN